MNVYRFINCQFALTAGALFFWASGCASNADSSQEESAGALPEESAGVESTVESSLEVSTEEIVVRHSSAVTDDELKCCTLPGQITECWTADAIADGVTCSQDDDCPSGECNIEQGLCVCSSDAECNDGVCIDEGLCGPSWCNGYRACSCWGGCDPVDEQHTYAEICAEHNMSCCEGTYPIHPDHRVPTDSGRGYCAVCGDDNPCTQDRCVGRRGCVHTLLSGDACDDGSMCTQNDTCSSGECLGDAVVCNDGNVCTDDSCDVTSGCVFTNNTAACNDEDACTLDDICAEGICLGGDARDCSDGNPCTDDSCDAALGCVYVLNDDLCDDSDACTVGERCISGVCGGGTSIDCDDGNVCTDDSCDSVLGCISEPNENACDDENACTLTDVCESGVCVGYDPAVCDDGNVCTDDSCDTAAGCVYLNNTDACDDGNSCTTGDVCSGGICDSTPVVCEDRNQCTDDLCGVSGCEYPYNDAVCDDGNACTVDDRCSQGDCAGVLIYWRFEEMDSDNFEGEILDWVGNYDARYENEAYTVEGGKLDNGGWFGPGSGSNVGKATTDYHVYDNSRTISFWIKFDDVTAGHQVVGSSSGAGKRFYLGIDDENQIFAGYGNAFVGWSHDSVPSTIEAGEWVRMAMTYDGGEAHVYVNGELLISFDAGFVGQGQGPEFFLGTSLGNVMIDEVIVDERTWDEEDVLLDYDDGNGPDPYRYVLNCDDDNPCTDDSCDKDEGCVHTPNTDACDDQNACTENDVCSNGVCGGAAVVCDDENSCTTDTCDVVTGCVYENNTLSCDDGNACTVSDVCTEGACVGEDVACDDENPCTTDTCDSETGCAYENNTDACDDANLCTASDTCAAGSCVGIPVSCDDGDPCTVDSCNPLTGCVNEEISGCVDCVEDADCEGEVSCDVQPDGCTAATCASGECQCLPVTEGFLCTGYSTADYPPNCYDGQCDAFGVCRPVMGSAENNLCSDLFEVALPEQVDETSDGWLGEFSNTQTEGMLTVTGSTLCANNNYYAGGEECEEYSTSNPIGTGGPDLAYVFRYQTNRIDQFELYSYVIKVQADFDVGIYIKTDIAEASDCPEGNSPDMDSNSQTFLEVSSERCAYPYRNHPMPPVVEDECRDNGNTLYGQDCCDPCADGEYCGYKWCKRGYNYDGSSCDMCDGALGPGYDSMTHTGNCDALWVYPDDPYECDSELPDESGYEDYNYKASAVISPDGAVDESTRTVFIFVDGVTSAKGNFYLTVEKRRWWAGPCDRVDDDGRVYDVTHVGTEGEVFQGSLENAVNSMHSCGGGCGGYGCDCSFSGKSSCHAWGDATVFWPNQEIFKVHRASGEGSGSYCITTDESVDQGADLVMQLYRRSSRDALTICDESYEDYGCAHDNNGSDIQWQVDIAEGYLYLIEVSQYQRINRVCSPSQGDDCQYRLNIAEGACPSACRDPSSWYAGGIEAVYTVDGTGFSPDSVIDGSTTSNSGDYDPGRGGWDGRDGLYQINVTADARVRFSGCNDGGSGWFDGQAALFDCEGERVAFDNDGCGRKGMPRFTADLSVSSQPYYLVVDGYRNSDRGSFGIGLSYQ